MSTLNLNATYTLTYAGDTEATTVTPTVRTRVRDGKTLTVIKNLAPLLADQIDAIADEGNRLHTLTVLSGAAIFITDTPEDDAPADGEMRSGSYFRDRGTLSTTYYGSGHLPVETVLDLAEQLRAQLGL